MKKIALIAALLFATPVFAQTAAPAASQSTCEAKAVSKTGKPLTGAAKASSIKKCEAMEKKTSCAEKAVDKNGKKLAGAAKNSFMKKCEKQG
ncbi:MULTISPECIES: hypothetical protein [Limnobacter]|uniref:PsiF repeat-containing protein n=1 Tax=Limnobacter litoralis TaxID=481366 RepID=A0ABQ5YRK5_9BURK|nr:MULTISPECIES: hypothetical protein [Limnobacter]GLR26759.1 hypothetical protein GCM10007875_18490 [Limnobacter litoralis]HEX5486817.1 hypothetical protein [Limnobacter sp.]